MAALTVPPTNPVTASGAKAAYYATVSDTDVVGTLGFPATSVIAGTAGLLSATTPCGDSISIPLAVGVQVFVQISTLVQSGTTAAKILVIV